MSMVQVLLYSFVTAVAVAPLAGKSSLAPLRVKKCLKLECVPLNYTIMNTL